MKNIFLPFVFLLLVACEREQTLPQATSAAKDIYMQYADHDGLTVALLGDYNGYNAVMLQAQNTEAWLQLCDTFGVMPRADAQALDTVKVSHLSVSKVNNASLPMAKAQQLSEIFSVADSSLIQMHLDTAYSIVTSVSYDHGVQTDSSVTVRNGTSPESENLLPISLAHGNCGYVVYYDSDRMAIWLFFYSNDDELNQILNHVTLNSTKK
jgi:hypothetical protein